MSPATTKSPKTKIAKLANFTNMSIQRRSDLEKQFIGLHSAVTDAEKRLRIDRVYAGQTLLDLKEGFGHGDWTPYLAKLCERAGGVPVRTAGRYMNDARVADKIPAKLLEAADRQGFDTKTRAVRAALSGWLLCNPESKLTPQEILEDLMESKDLMHAPPPLTNETEPTLDISEERLKRLLEKMRSNPRNPRAVISRDGLRRQQQETFAEEVIDAGYKTLAKKYHPDAGGTSEQFRLLKESTELLKKLLQHRGSLVTSLGNVG